MNQVFFNRPIDHQSTSNDRLKPVMTTGLVNMHIDRSIANLVFNRPLDHQSTTNDRLKPVMRSDYRICPPLI